MKRTARRPFRFLLLVPVVLVTGALGACGEPSEGTRSATAGLPDLEQSLTAHEWLLDPADSSLAAAPATSVTLAFDGAREISGAGPCNVYHGAVTLDGDDGVRIADVAVTRMSCEADVMAAEEEYLGALARVRAADVTDRDRLVLTGGDVRLSFHAIDASELVLGEWAITAVRSGDAISSVLEGTRPAVRFTDDRSLVVDGGCNTLLGTWRIDGQELVVELSAGTLKGCPEPAGVTDQEEAVTAALAAVSIVQVRPGSLTLLDGSGHIVLTAARD